MGPKVFKILFIIADPQGDADVRQKLADARTAAFEITTVQTLAQALVSRYRAARSKSCC
jgi:hypothetical protein